MIIIRYLIKETLKAQAAILFILLLIFFCQKLVKILSAAVDGDVPTGLIFSLLGLGVPDMAQLILPLSLFLGILMTYTKLYTESEITVMHACGLGRSVLLKAALVLSLLTGVIAALNVAYWGPWSQIHQDKVLTEAKSNPGMASLVEGQFQKSSDGNYVLFVGNVVGKQFHNVFLAQLRAEGEQRPSVVMASSGTVNVKKDGSQVITLDEGSRYEGTAMLPDIRVTHFQDYQAVIGFQQAQKEIDDEEQMTVPELLNAKDTNMNALAELNWRITLIFAVPLMAFMVVPLSVVNPRQGRVLSMLPAILLYLIFFLLQSSLRSNGGKGKLDPTFWMWLVNLSYLALAVLLNVWDSVPLRRMRLRLRGLR